MTEQPRGRMTALALLAVAGMAACADDATGPAPDVEVNPALEQATAESGGSGGLPQGATTFTGPDGLAMDATGFEDFQTVTLTDGTVWKASGVRVVAVPDESVDRPPFHVLQFGYSNTGSLDSVDPGTWELVTETPAYDWVRHVEWAYARVQPTDAVVDARALGIPFVNSDDGTLSITSLEYFDDVFTCDPEWSGFTVERCEYQLGLVEGVIEFRVTTDQGTMVQERTPFAIPLRRRTLLAHQNDS